MLEDLTQIDDALYPRPFHLYKIHRRDHRIRKRGYELAVFHNKTAPFAYLKKSKLKPSTVQESSNS